MKRHQPGAAKSQKPSSLNARKHGLTARLADSAGNELATQKLVDALTKGNRQPEILRAAEQFADLQITLVSVRREKTSLINRSINLARTRGRIGGDAELDGRGWPVACADSSPSGERHMAYRGTSESASLEAKVVAENLDKLAILDTYERRSLSRRRKAAFALLLAFEQCEAKG